MEHFKIPWSFIACFLFSITAWQNCKIRDEIDEARLQAVKTRFRV